MLKTGDIFYGAEGLKMAMQENIGIKFPQDGWIPHVPISPDNPKVRHPNIGAAKHIFYNIDFFPTGRWNEFDGVSKAEARSNCLNAKWIQEKTKVIHEIISPLANTEMPGAEPRNHYEPFFDLNVLRGRLPDPTQRLIFGQFRGLPNCVPNTYIFLGLYEYDTNYYNLSNPDKYRDDKDSFRRDLNNCKNVKPYKIDDDSFPKKEIVNEMDTNPVYQSSDKDGIRDGIQDGLIVYKHQVFTRIADHWPL